MHRPPTQRSAGWALVSHRGGVDGGGAPAPPARHARLGGVALSANGVPLDTRTAVGGICTSILVKDVPAGATWPPGASEWRERPTGVRRPVLQLPAGVRAKGAHGAFKATAAASACIAAVFLDAVPRFTCALLCAHRACAQHPPSCGFPPSAGCPPSSGFSPSITAHPLPTPHPACSRKGPGKPQDRHPVQDEGAPRTDAVAPPPARRTAHRSAYSGGPPRGQLLLPAPPRRGAVAWDELHDGVGCVWRRRSTLEP